MNFIKLLFFHPIRVPIKQAEKAQVLIAQVTQFSSFPPGMLVFIKLGKFILFLKETRINFNNLFMQIWHKNWQT